MKVRSPLLSLLTERALGIWPVLEEEESPANGTSLSAVSSLLRAEHQVARYLHANGLSHFEPLAQKSDDVNQALELTLQLSKIAPPQSIELLLAITNAAHMLLLNGDLLSAQKLLDTPVDVDNVTPSHIYVEALVYKKFFLLSRVHTLLQNTVAEKQALLAGINAFPTIPTPSNVDATQWLHRILERFNELSPSWTIKALSSEFKYPNFILYFINHFQTIPSDFEDFIFNRANTLLKSVSFPRADEKNNFELEEFIDLITQSTSTITSRYTKLVEDAIGKTYQSHIILRSYIRCLFHTGGQDQIRAAVEVYAEYIQTYYEQNGHTYQDIISILSVYDSLFNTFVKDLHLSIRDYDYWLKQLQVFRSLITEFYSYHSIEKVIDVDVVKVLNHSGDGPSLLLSEPLGKTLAEFWRTLGRVTFLLHHSTHSIYSVNKSAVDESVEDYKHAIYLAPQNLVTLLEYTKQIAELRKVKEAYRVLKVIIKSLSNKSLAYFESWHLLALILSVEENKDEAYKVINFISAEITDLLESETDTNSLANSLKVAFIQIKMTQLAIVEALFGAEQSLDSLPELFELFHKLFSSDIFPSKSEAEAIENVSKHRKSLSLNRTQTLSKIKSSITHKHPHPTTESKPESKPQPLFKINSKSRTAKRTLQQIWLLAATIYAKLDLFEDAEQAIIEAETVNGSNSETHSVLALLTSHIRPELSLKEYEKALIQNRNSLRPIIGFAALVLAHDYNEENSIFISQKDKYAAVARAKVLLETASETLNGAYTTEVWWILSKIYGKFDDSREKIALWKSVELEETRPVRSFDCVDTIRRSFERVDTIRQFY